MRADRAPRRGDQLGVLRLIILRRTPAFQRPPCRQITVDEIVGGGLVGDEMWFHLAPGKLGQDLRRIAEQPDRSRFSRGAGLTDERERLVDVLRLHVQITRLQAHLDARRLALDRQQRRARHRRRQRLRAAHAPQARGQDPFVG